MRQTITLRILHYLTHFGLISLTLGCFHNGSISVSPKKLWSWVQFTWVSMMQQLQSGAPTGISSERCWYSNRQTVMWFFCGLNAPNRGSTQPRGAQHMFEAPVFHREVRCGDLLLTCWCSGIDWNSPVILVVLNSGFLINAKCDFEE